MLLMHIIHYQWKGTVSTGLIERVKSGKWDPDNPTLDRNHTAALAARGYWQAFKAVEVSVRNVLKGVNPGKVADGDHRGWYREMFEPCVSAGIIKPTDLAGYRRGSVYIRHSKHVPLNSNAVRDLMPAFFDMLCRDPDASVRAASVQQDIVPSTKFLAKLVTSTLKGKALRKTK